MFVELLTELRNHLLLKLSVIEEIVKFHCLSQQEQKTMVQLVADLRFLAQTCEFAAFLDKALRAQLENPHARASTRLVACREMSPHPRNKVLAHGEMHAHV